MSIAHLRFEAFRPGFIRSYPIQMLSRVLALPVLKVLGTITQVTTDEPVAALTFDDGPHPEYTLRILDILEKYHAHATFFMLGENAQRYPHIVKHVAEAGHAIGNHSWDHPSFPLLTRRERREQIRACAKAIAPYGESLFRPPYGMQNVASRLDAFLMGYQVIAWNVGADDWRGRNAASIARLIERKIQPGCIMVLHDRLVHALDEEYFDREPTLAALQIVLPRLSGRFRLVTVPQLLNFGRPQRKIWLKKPDLELLNRLIRQEGPDSGTTNTQEPTGRLLPEP
jgi:peptidoglycan/xylan/chitin deacetylase (PgdA/CDA1 family)